MRRCALFAVLLSNRPAPQETGEVANGSADTHGETPHNHAMTMLASRTRYVLDHPWRFVGQALVAQIGVFLENWKVVGVTGLALLLFFSSIAFTVLENAMSVIFFHRVAVKRRHFLVSAIIPYCYISLLAVGMLVVNAVSGTLAALDARSVKLMGHVWSLDGTEAVLIYLFGVVGEIALLPSPYLVIPAGRLALRHALSSSR